MDYKRATLGWLGCLVAVTVSSSSAQELIRAMPPSGVIEEGVSSAPSIAREPAIWSSPSRTALLADDAVRGTSVFAPAPVTVPVFAPAKTGLSPLISADPVTPAIELWSWQVLPEGLMYRSYLAGGREPRFASQWVHERNREWFWDATLGGRVGMLRWGTLDPLWPEGWQIDIEGAAFPRLTLDEDRDLVSADFRFGIPITMRQGRFESKFGYYHLSSHLGDEYKITHPWLERTNFVRDALVLGVAVYPMADVRTYVEAAWAFSCDGGAKPWEFQFGLDYSPLAPSGFWGDPFFAVNGRLREEVDFGGNFTLQTGWQWRGTSGRLTRLGMHYFNGQSDQYQFYRRHEEQIGVGLWFDY
ncbi:MAG: DUF1207 domain-containing protein [Pirellulales bacterium]|nr:DUF1207 domain-containing protein [Pirellulales bacterium]